MIYFHIKCVKIPPEVYNFLKKGHDALKYGLFKWYCSKCHPVLDFVEKQNMSIDKIESQLVDLTSTIAANAKSNSELVLQEMKHLKDLVFNNQQQKSDLEPIHLVEKDYGNHAKDSVKTEIGLPAKHSLLLKPNDATSSHYTEDTWADVVRKNLPHLLHDVPVTKATLTKQGKGYLVFPNEKFRDAAVDTLKEDFHVECESKVPKLLYPKITINGIDKHVYKPNSTANLKAAILQKNETIRNLVQNQNKEFEIVFIKEGKESSDYTFAVAKVDPMVQKVIKNNGNKIFLDLTSCLVTDRYHLIQCYTCQKFGHKSGSPHCLLKNQNMKVCLYCSENHMSKDCPNKNSAENLKCANCVASNNLSTRGNSSGHTTTSDKCPVFQQALNQLIRKTMGIHNIQKNLVSRQVIVT